MKGESKPRGAGRTRARTDHRENASVRRKIFSKKGEVIGYLTEADLEREKREEQEWLKQGELTPDAWDSGREAAHDDSTDVELCRNLAGNFARQSARKTDEPIGVVRDRYETIAREFLAARYPEADGKRYSLTTVLRSKYESDAVLKEFLRKFATWIGEYVSDCIREHSFAFMPLYRQIVPTHTWTLCGHSVNRELLTALAEEYVRDRVGLMRFLAAAFKRWRKIYQAHSAWRVKVVTEQHANDVPHHRIARRLEKIGAVPNGSAVPGTSAYRKLRSKIKKIRSRDRKVTAEKKRKALAREARRATELKAWLECPSCLSKWTDGISTCPHCKVAVKKKSR